MKEDTVGPDKQSIARGAEDTAGIEAEIEEMRRLAVEIARAWTAPESAAELLEKQRR